MALAPVKLPRINAAVAVVQAATGLATITFKSSLDAFATAIENAFDAIISNVTSIQAAQNAAEAAQASVDTVSGAEYITLASSANLTNAHVLGNSTGVSVVTSGGNVTLTVDALAILNGAPVLLTQPVECPSIRIDETPTSSSTASDHSIPINCNGTTYYMRLSTAP